MISGGMVFIVILSIVEALIIVIGLKVLWEWNKRKKKKIIDTPPIDNDIKKRKDSNLEKLIKILLEEKEQAALDKRDKELSDYANKKVHDTPAGNIQSSIQNGEQPIRANTKGELVQFGMSERDRTILREFYDNK